MACTIEDVGCACAAGRVSPALSARACLCLQRAGALLARGWEGDATYALRDCDTALRIAPRHTRALLWRIHAFKQLDQLRVGAASRRGGMG
jgi:hypothetical protein